MGDLESLVAESKAKISALIQKPKMAEKLLSKPPFRFLHDTITAISVATGFAEGLYADAELDAAAMTDKNAKTAYLDKIFLLVGICKGAALEVRSIKVVQGLEPEFTNKFLIALADCASDSSIDNNLAVQRCLAGEAPGANPPPLKSGGSAMSPPMAAESKSSEPSGSGSKGGSTYFDDRGDRGAPAKEMEAKIPIEMEQVAPERGKSRGGTRGGRPNQATADTGLGGGFGGSMAPKLDAEIERCDGTEATTQVLLGELITRPKLVEKHLAKPPFRFLFDIVMEVIRATSFAQGLYSEAECDAANVTSRDQKMEFLEKIIKVVGKQLNTIVEAKPAKIVAGHDPQATNVFLQLLAVAAKHMPDSSRVVASVLQDGGAESPAPAAAPAPVAAPAAAPAPSRQQREEPRVVEREVPMSKAESSPVVEQKRPTPQPQYADPKDNNIGNRDFIQDDKVDTALDTGNDGGGVEEKRSTRPTTARRRPPKVKEGATELQAKDTIVAPSKKSTGIIVDGQDDDEIDEVVESELGGGRLADDMKAEGKGTADDNNSNNPQSKLVQNIMSRQVEQEAAGRSNNKAQVEAVDETKQPENAGGGIRLGRRLGKAADTSKKGAAATTGASLASTFAEGDLEKMRTAIQSLVQQTGPLGTCLDFIQEDIGLMSAELHKWEEECRRYEGEYEEARKKTKEKLIPLRNELDDLNDQIAEQVAHISATKASNSRLEEKKVAILKMIVSS